MFYETFSWWGLLVLCSALGFPQQIGAYGRGRKSTKIEGISNLLIVALFILSFFVSGLLGGLFLILIFIIINSTITKYLARGFFINDVGYVPSDREEIYKQVFEEFMSERIKDGFSPLDVEQEVEKRLNKKGYAKFKP